MGAKFLSSSSCSSCGILVYSPSYTSSPFTTQAGTQSASLAALSPRGWPLCQFCSAASPPCPHLLLKAAAPPPKPLSSLQLLYLQLLHHPALHAAYLSRPLPASALTASTCLSKPAAASCSSSPLLLTRSPTCPTYCCWPTCSRFLLLPGTWGEKTFR